MKRLIQSHLQDVIEMNNFTETLLIKAKCMKRKFDEDSKDEKIQASLTPAQRQKQILRISNYLLLALETCLSSRNFPLAKRIVGELYNTLETFLTTMQYKPLQIFHLLLKAQIVIIEVPQQYWDANLRILSAKITYEILKITLQVNEITLGKRVIYS